MTKRANLCSMVLNLLNVAFVIYSILGFFISTGSGNMQVAGAKCFMYFTIDSNILAALSSLCMVIFSVINVKSDKAEIPKWLSLFKFTGTTAVTVTFLTVIFFLGPTMGYALMFAGSSLFLHLINPLLCIISYAFLEKSKDMTAKYSLLGVLPTAVYGCVYIVMVVITQRWQDFYGFNTGGFWYISLVVMLIATYLFAIVLWKINQKISKRR